MPAKKVTVPVPESLYQWLSDTSEKDYRTVPQQIVFLCAHAFEGFIPALEVKPNVAVALDAAVRPEPAAAQPAVGSVPAVMVGQSRFAVLAKPPDGKVTTIHVHGIDNRLGASLSFDGVSKLHRIDPDLWIDAVEAKCQQLHGLHLSPLGQYGNWLYLQ